MTDPTIVGAYLAEAVHYAGKLRSAHPSDGDLELLQRMARAGYSVDLAVKALNQTAPVGLWDRFVKVYLGEKNP